MGCCDKRRSQCIDPRSLRRCYPDIKYHKWGLGRVARKFDIRSTIKVRSMSARTTGAARRSSDRGTAGQCLPDPESRRNWVA